MAATSETKIKVTHTQWASEAPNVQCYSPGGIQKPGHSVFMFTAKNSPGLSPSHGPPGVCL